MTHLLQAPTPLHALIVDDDPDSIVLLTALLQCYDIQVTAVHCVTDALQQLQQQPDILISDLAMPLMDGYDLIRDVRSRPITSGGTIPAIALSAWVALESQQAAIESGFHAFLPKPFDPEKLIKTISQLTGWRYPAQILQFAS